MIEWLKKQLQRPKPELGVTIAADNIPAHVAIIMDGNGRWANKRGLPRLAGHRSGMKAIKRITIAADDIGVKVLTLYSFSTENWKRPQEEVDYLMKLPEEFLSLELNELIAKNVRVRMTGWKDGLPDYTLKAVEEAILKTQHNSGLILNFAFNYGSRMEMLLAMRHVLADIQQGKLQPEQLTEEVYSKYLLTYDLPNPDLLIRTSGELRVSNFMLWQMAYTEMWFTEVYWPGFTAEHFYQAIREYQSRKRRYGGL